MTFEPLEKWIWLPQKQYPNRQKSLPSVEAAENAPLEADPYTVVRCERTYSFHKPIASVSLRTSGDTFFRLELNGRGILSGPAAAGGDFLNQELPRPQHYAVSRTLSGDFDGLQEGRLSFSALIRMGPVMLCECSQGRGGFFLTAHIRFADGEKTLVVTDESWCFSVLPAYVAPHTYNGALKPHQPVAAERIANVWHCLDSAIALLSETRIVPKDGERIRVRGGEEKEVTLFLGMVYTGYPFVEIKTEGPVQVFLACRELDGGEEPGETKEDYTFLHDDAYRGMAMTSSCYLKLKIINRGAGDAVLTAGFLASCYPADTAAVTTTSDEGLNLVTEVCTHTLKYCRQSIHLDSGRHCEPLACTGDYYIQSLMTAFTFGDMELAAFDVLRTAQLLRYNDGRMFHTTYSLIWVQMLWDVYWITGKTDLLSTCQDALILLLERFGGYVGETGLVENPPDYMFEDWLNPDGISTHHPPKALGQTCMNLFYYGALKTAEKIWYTLGEAAMAQGSSRRAEKLHGAIETHLFDRSRGVFFEGLNTPETRCGPFLPQNVSKRYYRMHANILAAYFGFFSREENAAILEKILHDEAYGTVQPYFAHFLLEAVYRNGLRDKYTLPILQKWKQPVKDYPYGLAEGFHKPEPEYFFDHSHAWGGTPAYALPLALSGLEIVEPGYRKIRLNPSLLGLDHARVQIPTPYGMIELILEKDREPLMRIPEKIVLV